MFKQFYAMLQKSSTKCVAQTYLSKIRNLKVGGNAPIKKRGGA